MVSSVARHGDSAQYQSRTERFFPHATDTDDYRTPFQHDFDRILHSDELRRLNAITQIVNESSAQVFHNRLTHSLKVAQTARRLAEYLIARHKPKLIEALGGLDPEVAAVAGLAHDLGHPVFGHAGEHQLNELIKKYTGNPDAEGYEGNAQSWRIVCKLSVHNHLHTGLNLTRASLNALLKYPNFYEPEHPHKKWGVYQAEKEYFHWTRAGQDDLRPCLEAQIMDISDDITYSSHDIQDMWRAGLIPLDQITNPHSKEARRFLDYLVARHTDHDPFTEDELREELPRILGMLPVDGPYRKTSEQLTSSHNMTSALLANLIKAPSLNPKAAKSITEKQLFIPKTTHITIYVLKALSRHYAIETRALNTLQHGQLHTVTNLFNTFCTSAETHADLLPISVQERLTAPPVPQSERKAFIARIVADYIASLTDDQAIYLNKRLGGDTPGSILDQLP